MNISFETMQDFVNHTELLIKGTVTQMMIESGQLSPYLSKNAAYKTYGRGLVDRWIKEKLIKPIKDGNHSSTIRLDRTRLEILSKTTNRSTYLTSIERK